MSLTSASGVACWTIGYHPDDPIEKVYAVQPTP